MSAKTRRQSLLRQLWRDDPMEPNQALQERVGRLRSRKWKKHFGKLFGIGAFYAKVGRRERALWYRGEYSMSPQARIVLGRRQRNCIHKWYGGGRTWTDCGWEYEPPTCQHCGFVP